MILSPDSDLVLANKQRVVALDEERARAQGEVARLDAEIAVTETAIQRLTALKATASHALRWTSKLNSRRGAASADELAALKRQRQVLIDMQATQMEMTRKADANLKAGLISQADYEREAHDLQQMGLALIDNDRSRVQSQLSNYEAMLGKSSLAGRKDAPPMPEVLTREEQLIRLELELFRLESEKHSKVTEREVSQKKVAQVDQLVAQLKARPIAQAGEKKLDVAFVPYTQVDGVKPGAQVYKCVWGIFHCTAVGSVAELVPGEVVMPDPWGAMARGQYAVLDLKEHDSATAKVLRVRRDGAGAAPNGIEKSAGDAVAQAVR
jgi:hypothetical protein